MEKITQSVLVSMMENVRTSGLSENQVQDAMAQIAWSAWNARLVDWESVQDACHRVGIADPSKYWVNSTL